MAANQSGQVLPLSVAMLLACSLLLVFVATAAQLVDEKIRLVNAADAAAYSAGIVEARGLNYIAYTNRAIIANQIAIAQAVSLASWTNYFADVWTNLDHAEVRLLELIPPNDLLRWSTLQVAFAGEAYATVFGGVDPRLIAQYVDTAAAVVVTSADLATQGLELSQSLVRQSLRGAEAPGAHARQRELAVEVAQRTDPSAAIDVIPATRGFDAFVKFYDGTARSRLADVVERSRDQFTMERAWTLKNALGFLGNKRLARRGGTRLDGLDRWSAFDDLTYRSSGGLFGGATKDRIARSDIDLDASPRSGSTSASYYFPALYTGLPAIFDLRDNRAGDPVTGLSVFASKPRTAASLSRLSSSGRLDLFEHPTAPPVPMGALARAEVFFARPDERADGAEERGSLYDPYWRVRLVEPTPADKTYAASRQHGLAVP